ncbi:MAG: HAMP domain-containing histidine kinase [Alphaproteobacteria bacterium]|nr:HAMP domain-containing histidine kinase [Alphaproteobacteria bacterium]MCB9794549.1 HAMP domain-containing histidine kinase [Alphaproteobacteria bacterium]
MSRLPGPLSRRLLAVMALGVILTLLLVFRAVVDGARVFAVDLAAGGAKVLADGPLRERCVSVGTLELEGGSRVDAFDLATLEPVNVASAPLSEEEQARVRAGELPWLGDFPMLRGRGVLLLPLDTGGPCSLLRVRWAPATEHRMQRLVVLLTTMALGVMLCVGLGLFWVVRPLLSRIEALSLAAGAVGGQTPTWPPEQQDELGQIAAALREAHERILADKAALAEKNEALRRHLADVAHDLRTPIASLQLALERLEEEPQARAQALSDAVYLEALTDNLGLAARLREGIAAAAPEAELGAIVARVAGRLTPLAEARGVSLAHAAPEAPTPVRVDPVAFERALGNLAHNAVRYADPGGNVALLLEVAAGRFCLSVLDDGPGVPPESLPRLTDRAWRGGEARQRDATGTGLGLAITAEVCRQAGLSLRFEALEPRGLGVRVEGPLRTELDQPPAG